MTLRRRLQAYLVAMHLLFIGVAALLWLSHPLLFFGAELLLLASLALGFHLVARALEPLAYTQRFHDLLQDQDYAGRLARTAVPELDELVDVFNTMLGTLYRERLEIGEQRGFLDACSKRRRARCWCWTSTAPSAWSTPVRWHCWNWTVPMANGWPAAAAAARAATTCSPSWTCFRSARAGC
jgi:hypothetical protein